MFNPINPVIRLSYNLVQLFILLIGVVRKVIIEIILGNSIYNVVCHLNILFALEIQSL